MRFLTVFLCILTYLFEVATDAKAQRACPPGAISVSRIAEIDTTGGPWFGTPHRDPGLLAAREVVLTFDDGPSRIYTRQILAQLAAQCIKATFFVVGSMAASSPDIVKEILAQGHTIGTHTYSHANLKRRSVANAERDIDAAISIVEKEAGQPIARFFRFPYLSENASVAEDLHRRKFALFAVDIDSLDYRTRDPKVIVRNVMAALERRDRGIILFHDIHASTVQALPELLILLHARGFKIVHIKPKLLR